jgi:hypothetical protein
MIVNQSGSHRPTVKIPSTVARISNSVKAGTKNVHPSKGIRNPVHVQQPIPKSTTPR